MIRHSSSPSSAARLRATPMLLLSLLAVAACSSCAGEPASAPAGPTLHTITIAPADTELVAGTSVAFRHTLLDEQGGALPARALQWASSDTDVATVADGMVTAKAPGTTTLSATASGVRGEARVTVRAATGGGGGGGSGALVTECAAPQAGWIWCDDFEQNRLASYFEVDAAGGRFTRLAGVGREGSYAMRSRYTTSAQTSSGNLKLAFGKTPGAPFRAVDAGTAIYREVYWRQYLYNPTTWIGGAGDKLSRAMVLVGTNWSQAAIAHVWGADPAGSDYLLLDPASGTDAEGNVRTTQYNDFANLRWLGNRRASVPTFSAEKLGQWHCVEARARLNDAGQANGVMQLWIDGALVAERTGLNFVGSYATYGFNAVFFENFWNNGSPVVQDRFIDNIVVSTQRIGC